jgi:hypothetical protein
MAYNLRTGLTGSGDIDVNVTLGDLNAANITSGIFDTGRIPTIGDSKLSDLNAAKLTGLVSADRIGNGTIPKLKISNTLDETWAVTEIPVLPKAQIDPYHNEQWHVDDLPTLGNAKISDLSATKLTGTIASERLSLVTTDIPTLPKTKVSTHAVDGETWPIDDIPSLPATKITSGQFDVARIPNLSAGKITADTLNVDRIPDLSADKITSDTLAVGRIPNLDASKITTGTISSARLPVVSTHDILDYNAINGDYLVKSVGNTYTTIHSSLRSNAVTVVPASQMVEIELSFYYNGLNYGNLLGRLVDGGTNYEYVDQVINNANLSTSTENTLVAVGSSSPSGYTTITWTLKFAAAQVGDDIDIEPQLKDDYPQETIGVRSGLNSTSGVCFPSTIFKITALPTTSTLTMHLTGGF